MSHLIDPENEVDNAIAEGDIHFDYDHFLSVAISTDDTVNRIEVKEESRMLSSSFEDLSSSSLKEQKSLLKKEEYYCKQCGKSFARRTNLQRHRLTHSGEKKFPCQTCNKCFARNEDLVRHMKSHAGIKPHQCRFCEKKFSRRYLLKMHEKIHERVDGYDRPTSPSDAVKRHACTICGRRYDLLLHLRQHMRTHSNDRPHACAICDQRFHTKSVLRRHVVTHTGETPFACNTCGRFFTRRWHLKNHIIRVHSDDGNNWIQTKDAISLKSLVKKEQKTEADDRPYGCPQCGKSFKHRSHLRQHCRYHTGAERPHGCQVCDQRFFYPSQLDRHVRTHTGDKLHICDICDKKFYQRRHLKEHVLKIHTDNGNETESTKNAEVNEGVTFQKEDSEQYTAIEHSPSAINFMTTPTNIHTAPALGVPSHVAEADLTKPHGCVLCGRRYFKRSHLNQHLRTHAAERPHGCEDCDKRFFTFSDLRRHTRTHTGMKPYECDICGRTFSQRSNIVKHFKKGHRDIPREKIGDCEGYIQIDERKRKRERPYCCIYCGRAFKRSNHVKQHETIHTGEEKKYSCEVCGKKFRLKSSKIRHVKMRSCYVRQNCDIFKNEFGHLKCHPLETADSPGITEDSAELVLVKCEVSLDDNGDGSNDQGSLSSIYLPNASSD